MDLLSYFGHVQDCTATTLGFGEVDYIDAVRGKFNGLAAAGRKSG